MTPETKKAPNRPTMIIAIGITWAGVILATLIMTYGAHGPAKHPKMFLVMPIVLGPVVASLMRIKSKAVRWTQILIFVGALIGSTFVSISEDSLPPIATTILFCICALISLGVMAVSTIEESSPDPE